MLRANSALLPSSGSVPLAPPSGRAAQWAAQAAQEIEHNFLCNVTEKEVDPQGVLSPNLWRTFEHTFNAIFLVELLVNMYGRWLRPFWCDAWNIFDLIVVSVGVISFGMKLEGPLKLLRCLRAFRVFRLFKRVKSLNRIIVMIVSAVPGVANALQTGYFTWTWMRTQEALVKNTAQGLFICFTMAFAVLLASTLDLRVGVLATVTIAGVVVTVMGVGVRGIMRWDLGIGESIAAVILIGLSVDYCVHLANAYCEADPRECATSEAQCAGCAYMGESTAVAPEWQLPEPS